MRQRNPLFRALPHMSSHHPQAPHMPTNGLRDGTRPGPQPVRAPGSRGYRPDVGVAPDEGLQVPLDIVFVGLTQDVSHAQDRLVQPRGLRALQRQEAAPEPVGWPPPRDPLAALPAAPTATLPRGSAR